MRIQIYLIWILAIHLLISSTLFANAENQPYKLTVKASHEYYKLGEPIEVVVTLENTTSEQTKIGINQSEYHGIFIEPYDDDTHHKVVEGSLSGLLSPLFFKTNLPINTKNSYRTIIDRFIRVQKPGNLHFKASMVIEDNKGKLRTLLTDFFVVVKGKISQKEIQKLVSTLIEQYKKGNIETRRHALASIQSFTFIDAEPLLKLAIMDNDDAIALEAVQLVAESKGTKSNELLQSALKNPSTTIKDIVKGILKERNINTDETKTR